LINRNEYTTWRVGSIGVRPLSTTKVRNADSSAIATANGASHFRRGDPFGSASVGSKVGAEVSALVIPACGELRVVRLPAD
jgi:hypothetical protein